MSKKNKQGCEFRGFTIKFDDVNMMWYAVPSFLLMDYNNSVEGKGVSLDEAMRCHAEIAGFMEDNKKKITPRKSMPKMMEEISKAISNGLKEKLSKELEEVLNG
jgi:hypothetical protein